MPKSSKRSLQTSLRLRRKGPRQELLPGDGRTFTLEMAMPRSVILKLPDIFRIDQTITSQTYYSAGALPSFGAVSISLAQIDQVITLGNLFDQYRFPQCEVWLTPQVSADISSASGMLFSVIDLDDSTALTTVGQAEDYTTCVQSPAHCGHYRHFIPHAAIAAYSGAFTSFVNVPAPWIDTASINVQHYGVKFASSPVVGTVTIAYDLKIRISCEFRAVR